MNYLIFDVETSGLPTNYNAPIHHVWNYPYITQLGMCISFNGIKTYQDFYRKTNGIFKISQEVTEKTGITEELLEERGYPVEKVLNAFLNLAKQADVIVCHNYNFDSSIIACELYRHEMDTSFLKKKHFCTMVGTTNICKLPNPRFGGEYKWPRLEELHRHLFNTEMEGAHNALYDVIATEKCFVALLERGLIKKEDILQ